MIVLVLILPPLQALFSAGFVLNRWRLRRKPASAGATQRALLAA